MAWIAADLPPALFSVFAGAVGATGDRRTPAEPRSESSGSWFSPITPRSATGTAGIRPPNATTNRPIHRNRIIFIGPGSPWRNCFIKSCNARFCDEFLKVESFTSLLEAMGLSRWAI
jgi:hypothetical protein